MEIIPAIDLINGSVVRLSQGDFERKTAYDLSPLELAIQLQEAGAKRLHLVDLDGAKAGSPKNLAVLEEIASKTNLVIDYSGGLRQAMHVESAFSAGAGLVCFGSISVLEPDLVADWGISFGHNRFILSADVRQGYIQIQGWLKEVNLSISAYIEQFSNLGFTHFCCTDISKDGMLNGPSTELYQKVLTEFPSISLIASGGIRSLEDIKKLGEIGCSGSIIGKAWLEGHIPLNSLFS